MRIVHNRLTMVKHETYLLIFLRDLMARSSAKKRFVCDAFGPANLPRKKLDLFPERRMRVVPKKFT